MALLYDIKELRKEYPFTKIVAYPYANPTKIELKVIAVNNRIIRECNAQADDFKGEFSKEIKVVIPFDYKNRGCDIYGGSWFDIDKIPFEDRHFVLVFRNLLNL